MIAPECPACKVALVSRAKSTLVRPMRAHQCGISWIRPLEPRQPEHVQSEIIRSHAEQLTANAAYWLKLW